MVRSICSSAIMPKSMVADDQPKSRFLRNFRNDGKYLFEDRGIFYVFYQ